MILDLDFGNTSGKWRVVDSGNLVLSGHFAYSDLQIFMQGLTKPIHRIRAVSVLAAEYQQYLFQQIEKYFSLTVESIFAAPEAYGLINGYEFPSLLGADRWVAIVAAWKKFGRACVVVDAGSALTIDCIDDHGKHCGGYILPGLFLMRETLNNKTGKIRIDSVDVGLLPGVNTVQAVSHGCLLALISAINSAHVLFAQQSNVSPLLVLTGGDAKTLLPLLSADVVSVPDLVFDGLSLVLP